MSATSKDLKKMDSQANLFIQWIPPDLLQPIQKFLTRRPFCDPYQQQQTEESDSESEDDHDTTTTTTSMVQDQVKTTETDNVERFIKDSSKISTTGPINGEDESHGSTLSKSLSLQESTHQREVLPMESAISSYAEDEEVELQLSQDGGVEISLDHHHQRSRSFSDTACQEIVDLLDNGVVSNATLTSNEASISDSEQTPPTRCSDARTIVQLILFWVGMLLITVILQPGSIYDTKWFLHKFQQTQDTMQTQLEECDAFFLGGQQETDCALESLRDHVTSQITACHAYIIHGETDTSCLIQVAGQGLETQSMLFWKAFQSGFHSIHDTLTWQVSHCQTFLQHGETSSGCILEPPYHVVLQGNQWINNQAERVLQYSQTQVDACQAYLTESEKKSSYYTGCFLEDAVMEWRNLEQSTKNKIDQTQQQLDRQFVTCQEFFAGRTGTDCLLETAQQDIHKRLQLTAKPTSELFTRIGMDASFYGTTFQLKDTPTSEQLKDIPMESLPKRKLLARQGARQEKSRKYDLSYFDNLQPIPEDQIPPRSAFKVDKKRGNKDQIKSRTNEPVVDHHGPTKGADVTTSTNLGDLIEDNNTINDDLTETDQASESEPPKEITIQVDEVDIEPSSHQAKISREDVASNPISSTTTTTPVVEFKNDLETWTDETDKTETTTETATRNVASTTSLDDGNLLGEMDFVKLEYDTNGIPYLVKGVKTMGKIR